MLILPKQYLSLADLASYFNAVSDNASYDLSNPDDLTRLYSDVYDLFIENKINIVFHYTGYIKETECDNRIDEISGKLANCKTTTNYHSSAYFSLSTIAAREILLEHVTMPRQAAYNLYCLSSGEKRDDTLEKIYLHEMLDNYFGNITVKDLRVPLNDVESLLSPYSKDSESNNKAKQTPIAPKKGISLDKQQAKEAGRLLARVLWQKDKDKKIRMAEMCDLVWGELYDSRFYDQIPDKAESIKSWVASEAPPYAREGGRASTK